MFYGRMAAGHWRDQRGVNVLDTGAPWYDAYETADGKHVAIGSIEGRFYAELIERLGLDPATLPGQFDYARWPELRAAFTAAFKSKTRDAWCREMEGTDVCFAPVLSLAEAPLHAHNQARGAFVDIDGVPQPAPAPRFSRTTAEVQRSAPWPGQHTDDALTDWGLDAAEVTKLRETGAIA
jgi:alpha-methylacyl-CoA racemase